MPSRRGPDNSVRVAISGTNQTENWANIFHCQLSTSSAIIQADLDTWTTAFQAAYKTNIAPVQGANNLYVLAKAVCYTPGLTQVTSSIAMTGNGGIATASASSVAISAVISWLTNVYWRGGKPRTYSGGLAQSQVTADRMLTGAAITAIGTAATNFRTAVNALTAGTITGTQFGFISYSTGNVPRSPAVFFPITGARVHPRLGTQRRRLGKWAN